MPNSVAMFLVIVMELSIIVIFLERLPSFKKQSFTDGIDTKNYEKKDEICYNGDNKR